VKWTGRTQYEAPLVALHCHGNVLEVLRETAITLGDDGWPPGDPEQEGAVVISGLRRLVEN